MNTFDLDASLPVNTNAERMILGAILLDDRALAEAEAALVAEDFHLDSHRRIFLRMTQLGADGHAIDLVTLANQLARFKEVESAGGVAYLASLTEGLPRRPVIEEYIRIVKDKSLLRQLILICSSAIARAADQGDTALEVLNAAESQLLTIGEKSIAKGLMSLESIVAGSFGSIDKLYSHQREVTGVATHFIDFDKMTSGLQRGELTIIAARPSMGKTAWAINIAQNSAIKGGATVGVFSLEMSKEALLRRMLSSQAWIDQKKIQTGFLSREDVTKLNHALEDLLEARIFIDDTPGISLAEMRAKARRLRQTTGALDLIVVDYLQLMSTTPASASGKRYENRTQEVSAISRGLKALAKEMNVPVIALSQLSRNSERRSEDKRPLLSDLRESGSIEQDADVVAFIHRESYYNRDKPEDGAEDKTAHIIIAKQRNGPTGTVKLAFFSEFTRFENLDHAYQQSGAY